MEVIELEPEPIPAACPALIDLSSPQKETRKETAVNLSSPPRASMINPVVNLISPSAPSAAAKTTRTTSVKSAKSAAVKSAVSAAAGEASGVADLPTDLSLIEDQDLNDYDCNSEDSVDLANMQKIQTRLGLTISMLNTVKAHVEVQTDKAKERKIQVNEWIMPGIMFLFTWVAEWLSLSC